MKLFDKLKQKLGINSTQSIYTIKYVIALTPGQISTLSSHMITKFPSNCRPNSISVSHQSATITMSNPCLSGEQLKKVSDDTLAQSIADIDAIDLDGNEIWKKPAVHFNW